MSENPIKFSWSDLCEDLVHFPDAKQNQDAALAGLMERLSPFPAIKNIAPRVYVPITARAPLVDPWTKEILKEKISYEIRDGQEVEVKHTGIAGEGVVFYNPADTRRQAGRFGQLIAFGQMTEERAAALLDFIAKKNAVKPMENWDAMDYDQLFNGVKEDQETLSPGATEIYQKFPLKGHKGNLLTTLDCWNVPANRLAVSARIDTLTLPGIAGRAGYYQNIPDPSEEIKALYIKVPPGRSVIFDGHAGGPQQYSEDFILTVSRKGIKAVIAVEAAYLDWRLIDDQRINFDRLPSIDAASAKKRISVTLSLKEIKKKYATDWYHKQMLHRRSRGVA